MRLAGADLAEYVDCVSWLEWQIKHEPLFFQNELFVRALKVSNVEFIRE